MATNNNKAKGGLILGIDLGTTSIKVCIYDPSKSLTLEIAQKETEANIKCSNNKKETSYQQTAVEGGIQSVPKIISALEKCMENLSKAYLQQVTSIGICGQMHGICFWNSPDCWQQQQTETENLKVISHLYTWQDNRCSSEFLASLPVAHCHYQAAVGYGCPTIFWLQRNQPKTIQQYHCCGTIQDYLTTMLCHHPKVYQSPQIAASWGYFDCQKSVWNTDLLKSTGFPTHLLPTVTTERFIGKLHCIWHSIPESTPVGAALGDLQCSVLATIGMNPKVACLNMSTSAQLVYIAKDFRANSGPAPKHLEPIQFVPYFQGSYLGVAASLNGGNILVTFVRMLQEWMGHFHEKSIDSVDIWATLFDLVKLSDHSNSIVIDPICLGERHDSDGRASVVNIQMGNLQLGSVFRALCHGLVKNLYRMLPKEVLQQEHIIEIVGTGSCLLKNVILQDHIRHIYELPLSLNSDGDAAKGVAMAMTMSTI